MGFRSGQHAISTPRREEAAACLIASLQPSSEESEFLRTQADGTHVFIPLKYARALCPGLAKATGPAWTPLHLLLDQVPELEEVRGTG